ncbi:Two-component response regulator ARR2 [Striga hermonthica]|uniref:Two-component response regulator ARR2 n=1 Tax=Striga hermonthica TaxID=68872 RepID=A0A9N7P383_STRHE|nr:Two-component response regulator ARR2 [Striga hermonthica]
MDTKGICILLVKDDLTCNNVVSQMLQLCNYQVLHVGSVLDVLNAIWEAKKRLDFVLTNAHKLESSNGLVIIQHIQKKLNLPVVLMSADKTKISSKDQELTYAAYVMNGLSKCEVNSLWQFALGKVKEREENVRKSSICNNFEVGEKSKICALSSEDEWFDQKRKRKELVKSKIEGVRKNSSAVAKKPRVVWTMEMHQKFLEAIEIIGYEKAVPKKIVEVMGISGLTRENVASHLQKYRGSSKRTQEIEQYISAAKSYDYNNRLIKSANFVGYRLTDNGSSIKFGNLEDENEDKWLSLLGHHQDTSTQSTTVKMGNDFPVRNSEEFSQMAAQTFDNYFLDEAMMKGEGDQCWQLDWEEFCDALFEHDD